MDKIAILIQGPHSRDIKSYSTVEAIKKLNSMTFRNKFYVICSMWEDEPDDIKQEVESLVEKVVFAKKPACWGAGNRNIQVQGVVQGIEQIKDENFKYLLKTRSDIELSEKFLNKVLELANTNSEKILVTNVFTRYENFHISDLVVFSTFENMQKYFDPSTNVYYEDLYSPEVQFPRMFIRNKGLLYSMRLVDYLSFLRDWIELVDFEQSGLIWYKDDTITLKVINNGHGIIYDRDCGPVLTKCLSEKMHRFIKNTKIPLDFIATFLLIADVIMRFIILRFKKCFNYHFYFLDPYGPEFAKTVHSHSGRSDLSKTYFNLCRSLNLQNDIDELAKKLNGKKVIVYGAGTFANIIFELYDFSKLNIIGICDRKYEKTTNEEFFGHRTYSTAKAKELDFEDILLTTFDFYVIKKHVEKNFKNKKLNYHSIMNYEKLADSKKQRIK